MKRGLALILIALLVLNTMGYYGVFLGLRYHNTVSLNQRLDDEDFDEAKTITFKVPISLPYYPNTDFERVSGEIEYDGEFYHLIKQKYVNDTLHVVCYKDVTSKRIKQALADYVTNFAHQSADLGSVKSVPSFIKDYIISDISMMSSAAGWTSTIDFKRSELFLTSISSTILSPPPEV